MAHFPQAPTLCEVTYDSDWYDIEDDRFLTPYRYSLLRNGSESQSDTVSLTLPSFSYYEYLRSIYECRTTYTHRAGYPGPSEPNTLVRSNTTNTWPALSQGKESIVSEQRSSRQAPYSDSRARTGYPFPTVHFLQSGGSGDELEDYELTQKNKEKLVWVDALNKWVPDSQIHPRPYMSFIGNAPVVEKLVRQLKEQQAWVRWNSAPGCSRDMYFMSLAYAKSLVPGSPRPKSVKDKHIQDVYSARDESSERQQLRGKPTPVPVEETIEKANVHQLNAERREAVRKRAQEVAEQRRNRKAYSSPLYSSLAERKQRTRLQAPKVAVSTPTSPTHEQEKAPSPREVWKEGDSEARRARGDRQMTPRKKEITIRLASPKPESVDDSFSSSDSKDRSDKKVQFKDGGDRLDGKGKFFGKDKGQKKDDDLESRVSTDSGVSSSQQLLQRNRNQQLIHEQQQRENQERLKMLQEQQLRKQREQSEIENQLATDAAKTMSHLEHKPSTENKENHSNITTDSTGQVIVKHRVEKLRSNTAKPKPGKPATERKIKTVMKPKEVPKPDPPVHVPVKTPKGLPKEKTESNPVQTTSASSHNGVSIVEHEVSFVKQSEPENEVTNVAVKSGETWAVEEKEDAVKIIKREENILAPSKDQTLKNSLMTGAKRRKGRSDASKAGKKTVKGDKKGRKGKDEYIIQRETTLSSKPLPPSTNTARPAHKELQQKKVLKPVRSIAPHKDPSPPKELKPMLTGMSKSKKQPPDWPKQKEEKLTVSTAADLLTGEPAEPPKTPPGRRTSIRPIVKKERRERPCAKKQDERIKSPDLPSPTENYKKVDSWIFKDNFSSDEEVETKKKLAVEVELKPSFQLDLKPSVTEAVKQAQQNRRKSTLTNLIAANVLQQRRRLGRPDRDSSYQDELRRMELAEERRKRQMEMLERIRGRQIGRVVDRKDDGSPHFEDYGFLAKYCIFTKGNIEMYRHAFDAVDDENKGYLEGQDVMIALRGVNSKLTEAEEEYLYRVLELTGYKVTNGADFKMFSVLAALSQRISTLDEWMRNIIGQMDFKALEMKLFMCKTLWECNVDSDTNKISIDQLCVELRAGGISFEHELEVREKLSHLAALDLFDFLTYVPLFITIHQSVIRNPLDDTREK